jgi:hypothetical protein
VPTPVQTVAINEKKDELLLNVDEETPIDHENNTSTKILEDLCDLQFEQNNNEPIGKRISFQDVFQF